MRRLTTAALLMLLLVQAAPGAGEKQASKKQLDGAWKHTVGDNSITFRFKGNTLHAMVKTSDNSMEVDADYGVSKDGVLFGRISKVKKEGDGPSEGDLFSFRFRIDGNTLTVSDLKTPHENGEAKELLQGDYHRQKEKAK
jgi:hypothetical protein